MLVTESSAASVGRSSMRTASSMTSRTPTGKNISVHNKKYLTLRCRGAYFCPHCWVQRDKIESGATLIVSPSSISFQWIDEIQKHIKHKQIKMLFYKGSKESGYIQPRTLGKLPFSHGIVKKQRNNLIFELNSVLLLRKDKRVLDIEQIGSLKVLCNISLKAVSRSWLRHRDHDVRGSERRDELRGPAAQQQHRGPQVQEPQAVHGPALPPHIHTGQTWSLNH